MTRPRRERRPRYLSDPSDQQYRRRARDVRAMRRTQATRAALRRIYRRRSKP